MAACGTAYGDGGNSNEQGPVSYNGVQFDSVGFQCVELVMRYMYYDFGVAPYSANGNTVVSNYSGSVFTKNTDPAADGLPSVGDILSFAGTSSNPSGHTSIVIGVSSSRLTTLNENDSSDGLDSVPVSNGVVGGGVTGWLHKPGGSGSSLGGYPSIAFNPSTGLATAVAEGPSNSLYAYWQNSVNGQWSGPLGIDGGKAGIAY